MHKRVGLARAVASKPDIIFFDEPTTGLDPIMTDVINHLIQECVQELGATTLTITHDMTSVRAIADKTALLYKGEIIWQGSKTRLDGSRTTRSCISSLMACRTGRLKLKANNSTLPALDHGPRRLRIQLQ